MELILRTRRLTSGVVWPIFIAISILFYFRNYIEGTKLLGAYAYELSQL